MGLHYSTRLIIDGAERAIEHTEDILDACDKLVDMVEQVESDSALPQAIRDMADTYAASLIRTCYKHIIPVDGEQFVQFTQVGMPMIRLAIQRHADIEGTPTPVLVDNLTGQPA